MKTEGIVSLQSEDRQQKIARLLKQNGKMRVTDLIEQMQSAPATIRRDLIQMSERGELFRTRGFVSNVDFQVAPSKILSDGKLAIGKAAAALVPNGSSVVLDSGTTALAVANQLVNKKKLRIVTNSLPIASCFSHTDSSVMLTGGVLDNERKNLVGPETDAFIKNIHTDIAFITITGFRLPGSLMCATTMYSGVKKAILESANQIILITEEEKFRIKMLFKFGDLSMVDTIVTDKPIKDRDILETIARHKVQLVVAGSALDKE